MPELKPGGSQLPDHDQNDADDDEEEKEEEEKEEKKEKMEEEEHKTYFAPLVEEPSRLQLKSPSCGKIFCFVKFP